MTNNILGTSIALVSIALDTKQGCRKCTDALAQGRIGAVTEAFALRDCPGSRKKEFKNEHGNAP